MNRYSLRPILSRFNLDRRAWIGIAAVIALVVAIGGAVAVITLGDDASPDTGSTTARVPLRVAFLGPTDAAVRNLYLADLETGTVTALTDAPHGVEDFAPSPDGTQIAYSRHNEDGTIDLWLVDVATGQSRPITRCVEARCTAPTWKPDGTQIAYQRQEIGYPEDTSRAWIVDLATLQPALFFDDVQVLGRAPAWSPDGSRLAVYDPAAQAIRVHDLAAQTDTMIASDVGMTGTFAPDGSRLVYPVLVRGAIGQEFYTHQEVADFITRRVTPLSGDPDAAVDDAFAAWSPDGSRLVVARRYLDERYTAGKQLYLLEVESGAAEPLVIDAAYNHAAPQWDATGRFVVYQRFLLGEADAQPEIWVIDTHSGERQLVATNMFLPAWVG